MVVYNLLKKHAFAVLKCQKNGPSDQSEMTQDQSWPQGAHVWWCDLSVYGWFVYWCHYDFCNKIVCEEWKRDYVLYILDFEFLLARKVAATYDLGICN